MLHSLRNLRRTLVHHTLRTALAATTLTVAVEVTTHLPSEGRSSQFYHDVCDRVAMPLVRMMLDPETAHNLAVEVVRRGWAPRYRAGVVGRNSSSSSSSSSSYDSSSYDSSSYDSPIRHRGAAPSQTWQITTTTAPFPSRPHLRFANPVGLAAGFDKDGIAIPGLLELGFGFVEIGSVTPQPQPGNPVPRMWRLSEDRAVINRYGFNSVGVEKVQENLQKFVQEKEEMEELYGSGGGGGGGRKKKRGRGGVSWTEVKKLWAGLQTDSREGGDQEDASTTRTRKVLSFVQALLQSTLPPSKATQARSYAVTTGILGVNLGKNKTSTEEIPDYTRGIRRLGPYADYLVINISSPNTPGLRGLQRREPMRRLLEAAVSERDALPTSGAGGGGTNTKKSALPPLLVKIAPDVSDQELEDIAAVVQEVRGVDGVIVSNTSTGRPDTLRSHHKAERGGLSGAPIRQLSTDCIRKLYALTEGNVPIIGVGGVGSGRDAYDKLRAGASLVQVYSMMVYEGPGLVSRIRGELAEIMVQNGQRRVGDVVGLDHEEMFWRKREERLKMERDQEKVIAEGLREDGSSLTN